MCPLNAPPQQTLSANGSIKPTNCKLTRTWLRSSSSPTLIISNLCLLRLPRGGSKRRLRNHQWAIMLQRIQLLLLSFMKVCTWWRHLHNNNSHTHNLLRDYQWATLCTKSSLSLFILCRNIKINRPFTSDEDIITGTTRGIKRTNNLLSFRKSIRRWFKKLQQLDRQLRAFVSLRSSVQVWILWLLSSFLN